MKTPKTLVLGIATLFTMCMSVTTIEGLFASPLDTGVPPTALPLADSSSANQVVEAITPAITHSGNETGLSVADANPTGAGVAGARIQSPAGDSVVGEVAVSDGIRNNSTRSEPAQRPIPDGGVPETGGFVELPPAPTPTLAPTPTETVSQQLKSRIVFYLIVPEKGRTDACGNISLIPIISKRHRTGDKLRDMQIGLQMLFDLGARYYGPYYNALWDTRLTINSVEYRKKEDYAIIDFGGFLPVMQMSKCDKRGVRNQIWKTFFHYEFREKTFSINGAFLIDQLNR